MYSSKDVVVVVRCGDRKKKRVFQVNMARFQVRQGLKFSRKMALDVASLTLDDSQASLASMPEELWRKVT